jgi:hypothetical protein
MLLTSLLISTLTGRTDRISFAIMTLVRRDVLDSAVAVLSVVPVHKAIDPGSHEKQIPEATHWIALVGFHGAEP